MPESVKSFIKMFADDAKVFSSVNYTEQAQQLQNDLNELQLWSSKWQLRFNASKCKVMHLGHSNKHIKYQMKDSSGIVELESTDCEKDLGVHVDPKLRLKNHCEKIVSQQIRYLALLEGHFTFLISMHSKYFSRDLFGPSFLRERDMGSS